MKQQDNTALSFSSNDLRFKDTWVLCNGIIQIILNHQAIAAISGVNNKIRG